MSATPSPMTALALLRDALADVPGVVTCRVGLEANMTPQDYPMVRIVPSSARHGDVLGRRSVDCLIYFGRPVHEFDAGMEALYTDLFTMEAALIDATERASGIFAQYRETLADEDRIDGYKLMALRVTVEG